MALERVSKRFGATRALSNVDLELRPGEVHALAGANGAGKSTLIRILAGVWTDYEGELWIRGAPVRLRGPADARHKGIATIHQELSLVGALPVADNIALTDDAAPWAIFSAARARARAREVLDSMRLDVDPAALVESLPLATRQLIEVARALAHAADVLILDEPTSALSEGEIATLFAHVEKLKARGVCVVFISHKMEEIFALADRVSILRDGAIVHTGAASALDAESLIGLMVGERGAAAGAARAERGPVRLSVRCPGVSFEVGRGEIYGVTGLAGSGMSTLARAIFGAEHIGELTVKIDGERLPTMSPRACINGGLILLVADRTESLVQSLSVAANTTLSALPSFARHAGLDQGAERRAARDAVERFRIVCGSIGAPVSTLSGGNQQKVALARCLEVKPKVLVVVEPTRGIDVAAKADVLTTLHELAATGVAIVVVSSELEELCELCDRIAVMSRGALVLEQQRGAFDHAAIVTAAMGGTT